MLYFLTIASKSIRCHCSCTVGMIEVDDVPIEFAVARDENVHTEWVLF